MQIDKIIREIRSYAGNRSAMIGIQKRPNKPNYEIRVYCEGKSRLFSLGTPRKREAQTIEGEIRARLRQNEADGVTPQSTREFFAEWLATKEKSVKGSSWKRYRAVLDKAVDFMGDRVHETTGAHLERYRDWLTREGYKANSIRHEIRVLRDVFKKAECLGYIKGNPTDGVEKPKKAESEVVRYSDRELLALFAAIDRRVEASPLERSREAWTTYRELFYCLRYTALRVSDATALQWENVSLSFGTIKVRQIKTGKEVLIRMPTAYRQRLEALARAMKGGKLTGLVYSTGGGLPVTQAHLDGAIRRALKDCGFKKKSPLHAFRHTVAMQLLDAKVPIHQVAAQLGDSVETVVRNYVKREAPAQEIIDVAMDAGSLQGHLNLRKAGEIGAVESR